MKNIKELKRTTDFRVKVIPAFTVSSYDESNSSRLIAVWLALNQI